MCPLPLGCDRRPSPRGTADGAKRDPTDDGRVSDLLDLAATIRLSAGDDLTRNCASEQQRGDSDG